MNPSGPHQDIIIKVAKIRDKRRILKLVREKQLVAKKKNELSFIRP